MAEESYDWLDAETPEYKARKEGWKRDERRHYGQDAVLIELQPFDWEEKAGPHFKQRTSEAVYVNLPRLHTSTVVGHLRKHAPRPGKGLSFGDTLGEVRERKDIDQPTRAELLWYNLNGVGNDGSSWEAWWDAVDERAQSTGHRWLMVESPTTPPANEDDERRGLRPFPVEFSPLDVPMYWFADGQLQFAIIRIATDSPKVEGGEMKGLDGKKGYYLLVKQGCELLGSKFSGGGWWKFDSEKKPIAGAEGTWDNTEGQIPLFIHFGRAASGTSDHPAMSASDTMELGQLAIEMMNTHSARKFDFWDACASKLFVLGATPAVMNVVSDMYKKSQLVPVPRAVDEDTGEKSQPVVWDGSTGAVTADVADKLDAAQLSKARQLSIEKVTTPGESGTSKNAGFAEASAPDLVRRAMLREQSENTMLYFLAKRFGVEPRGSCIWPRDFNLQDLVDDIDAMFDTLKRAGVESATLIVEMIMTALQERRVLTDEKKGKVVRGELETSFTEKAAQRKADQDAFNRTMTGEGDVPPTTGTTPPKRVRIKREGDSMVAEEEPVTA